MNAREIASDTVSVIAFGLPFLLSGNSWYESLVCGISFCMGAKAAANGTLIGVIEQLRNCARALREFNEKMKVGGK